MKDDHLSATLLFQLATKTDSAPQETKGSLSIKLSFIKDIAGIEGYEQSMTSLLAVLHSVLFMNRESERTKMVGMDTSEIVSADTVNIIIYGAFGFYTLIQCSLGKLNVTSRTVVMVTLNCAFLQILTFYLQPNLWGSLLLVAYLTLALRWLPRKKLSPVRKAVLITGCDRGIGFSLAQHLDAQGFHVFASFLNNQSLEQKQLVKSCSNRLQTIQMDVSNVKQVEAAAKLITTEVRGQELEFWGVINNAGICFIGNVEIMAWEDMNKVMAINYFGPVNVCKAFLPLLRQHRGRLVNVASNAGLVPVPLMGVYCASKAALATMSEVWRFELQRWGIKVATVIPSGYKTGILAYDKAAVADRWWSKASDTVQRDYGRECFNIKFKQKNSEEMLSANFSEILNNITDALLSTYPKSYYYNGFLARSLPFLYLHLPAFIGDPIMSILTDWFDFQPNSIT
ncbi:D-beta-hydroxybutyrate dehydrogenase, mitochondrial-like [Ylistrum balloti]|uniref:D-beta-hydroxybutyrate dehydrogenase, mitochondrial-like n=1 Tax=Ylistrum balloti TaxID=509963 RepID=UPI002905961A|nr:D-beta-hydroxybutyrate dehydrogenase, mitochondrial-like [Ylistrum balloti]